jgi:DNA-binding SARP family transcriptional activator/tetratricopeptide (TPR) repeat protein
MRLLRTFGGLALVEGDGSSALPEAAQRRLVLLALAVEAGDRGLPRDRAVAFLWPEADEEHARRSLNQLRYTLRRELGADPLVGTLTLRPDSAVLTSDLENFRAAVAAGQVDTALSLHAAPFLDGVALGGSPELDEWAESCRAQSRRALTKLVEHAARDASTRGDCARSEFLWRRLVQLEPLAAPPVVGLMETLAARGDATGALVVAAEHEATVQRELGVAPDASVRATASQVRARTAAAVAPPAVAPSAIAPSAVAPSAIAPPAVAPSAIAPSAVAPSAVRPRLLFLAAGLAAIALGTFAARRNSRSPAPAANTVAVLPFEVHGDPGYQFLGEGMVTLLSAKLDGTAVLRPSDGRAVVSFARQEEGATGDPARAAGIAEQLGAGTFVLGDVIAVGGRLRLLAVAYRLGNREPVVRAGVEGEPSALFALVDSLAGILLEGLSEGSRTGAAPLVAGTSSLKALKVYLEGEQLFRTGKALAAYDAFVRAVALDSTFALASYWASVAGWWADQSDVIVTQADHALRHADRVGARDRRLLVAWDTLLHGDTREAERIYRAVLGDEPDNVAAWSQLGEVLFHYAPRRGAPLGDSRTAFERVLKYEPGEPGALIHLARIAAVDKDYRLLDSITRYFDRTDSVGEWRQETHSIQAAVRNDSAGLARAAAELADAPDGRILNEALYAWRITLGTDAPRQLLEPLTSTTRPPEVRAFGHVSLAWLELVDGKLARARQQLALAAALDSVTAMEHGALMLLFPFVPATPAELNAMRDKLNGWIPDRAPNFAASRLGGVHDDAHLVLRDYLVGGLSARLGDTAEAERRAALLDRAAGPADLVLYARAAAAGVRAQAAIAAGHLDQAATLLQRSLVVQSRVARLGPSAFYPRGLDRYLLAESLRSLGREAEARQWYNSFYNSIFDAPFVAPAQKRLAEVTP